MGENRPSFHALLTCGRPKQTDSSRIVRRDMQAGDACLRLGERPARLYPSACAAWSAAITMRRLPS